MGLLCFGSNRTMCFLAVDFRGGVGDSAPSPSWHSCCLSAEGLLSSSARSQVWRAPGKELCSVGSPAQPVLQKESLGGVRPPPAWTCCCSPAHTACLSREKQKELSPPVHSRAVSALMGASADTLVTLVWHSLGGQGGWGRGPVFQVALCHLS